jgi:predicted DNA-binding ribbon-helix-helix protein
MAVQSAPRPAITMKSLVVKRSIMIGGHKTSVSVEEAFWTGLKEIAVERNASLSELVARIDTERELGNLSSAIRLFVLGFYRDRMMEKAPDLVPPK